MTKAEINTTLQELNKTEMSKENLAKGKPLLEAYQLASAISLKEQKENFVTEGGIAEDFKPIRDEGDVEFDQLWAEYSKLKKEFKEKLANVENDNLSIKEGLLQKLKS